MFVMIIFKADAHPVETISWNLPTVKQKLKC